MATCISTRLNCGIAIRVIVTGRPTYGLGYDCSQVFRMSQISVNNSYDTVQYKETFLLRSERSLYNKNSDSTES